MNDAIQDLAKELRRAIDAAGTTVDSLAERTKVPRTTILHLLSEPVSAILPERVYLRGHLAVLARELRSDEGRLAAAFDAAYPSGDAPAVAPERARFKNQSVAVSATLGGVALLSVVAAFVSALQ